MGVVEEEIEEEIEEEEEETRSDLRSQGYTNEEIDEMFGMEPEGDKTKIIKIKSEKNTKV